MENNIRQLLTQAFEPKHLEIINNSHLHASHNKEAAKDGQTHFEIIIVSAFFQRNEPS